MLPSGDPNGGEPSGSTCLEAEQWAVREFGLFSGDELAWTYVRLLFDSSLTIFSETLYPFNQCFGVQYDLLEFVRILYFKFCVKKKWTLVSKWSLNESTEKTLCTSVSGFDILQHF